MKSVCPMLVCAALTMAACGRPALLRVSDARHLASDALIQFEKATVATNRAVMAQTDAESAQLAADARQARIKVQDHVDALKELLRSLDFGDESAQVAAFEVDFAEYVRLDDTILGLAVENTNVKARALAFGPAFEAADAVDNALADAVPSTSANWRLKALAYEAIAATREIQALQAPHIEEAQTAAMDAIEARMSATSSRASMALAAVKAAAPADARARAVTAESSFATFTRLHAQILELSRHNTNVRSLALVMEQKGQHLSACERDLQMLTDALGRRTTAASR